MLKQTVPLSKSPAESKAVSHQFPDCCFPVLPKNGPSGTGRYMRSFLTALLFVSFWLSHTAAAEAVITGIKDIQNFLEQCPTADPAFGLISQDFEILLDGLPVATPTCTPPISTLPISQFTDALVALQTLRTGYYMNTGTAGYLPWTTMGLYDWMASNISGINLKTASGQLYCCDYINGKYYFSDSLQTDSSREYYRTWTGIGGKLAYYAHEIRHLDPGSPGHVTGCAAFPSPSGPYGCDATYDPNNLGSYGLQYWLFSKWATGDINVGIGCAIPSTAYQYVTADANAANGYLSPSRFVTNTPPTVTATLPYGGICQYPKLTVAVSPAGEGFIVGQGISCPADCESSYDINTVVPLTAIAGKGYQLGSWSGCTPAGNTCNVTMNTTTSATAYFSVCSQYPARRTNAIMTFTTLQSAYDSNKSGGVTGDTLQAQAVVFPENLDFSANVTLTFRGGYDCNFTTHNLYTAIDGTVTVSKGTVTVENLIIL